MFIKTKNELLVDESVDFQTNNYFFSITNEKGIIELVNHTFIKVSEYPLENLIGSPHNLVRHPDMPKSIFNYMWNKIKSKNIFTGYIKNRSKSGKYYWVFTLVIPVGNQYISMRMKAENIKNLELIKILYSELIKQEKSKQILNVDYLDSYFQKHGYLSYDNWILAAFDSEINLRHSSFIDSKSPTNLEILLNLDFETFKVESEFDQLTLETVKFIQEEYPLFLKKFKNYLSAIEQTEQEFNELFKINIPMNENCFNTFKNYFDNLKFSNLVLKFHDHMIQTFINEINIYLNQSTHINRKMALNSFEAFSVLINNILKYLKDFQTNKIEFSDGVNGLKSKYSLDSKVLETLHSIDELYFNLASRIIENNKVDHEFQLLIKNSVITLRGLSLAAS